MGYGGIRKGELGRRFLLSINSEFHIPTSELHFILFLSKCVGENNNSK